MFPTSLEYLLEILKRKGAWTKELVITDQPLYGMDMF